LTPEQKEWRRLRALELKTAGWKQKDIAAALGVTTGAVCQWVKRAEEGGDSGREALRRRKAPGGKATEKLPRPHLLAHLTRLLESAPQEGAEAFGFIGKQWTLSRVQVALAETLGVLYHRSHVHRLLRQAGFTPQLPETKATQRDEERIKEFRGREWRRLKRGHEEQVDA
jgi:putative transposase